MPPPSVIPEKATKRVPLSLEELLDKRKKEEEELSKPKFLTKEERAELALKKRQEQVEEQRRKIEEARKGNADFSANNKADNKMDTGRERERDRDRNRDRERTRDRERDRDRDRRDDDSTAVVSSNPNDKEKEEAAIKVCLLLKNYNDYGANIPNLIHLGKLFQIYINSIQYTWLLFGSKSLNS